MESLAELVRTRVFPEPSTDRLFNFYVDSDPALDLKEAAAIRRDNLLAYLEAAPDRPEILLLAEAPGPRGCRFTGVPITSEAQLESDMFPYRGKRSSTADKAWTEYSAGIVWGLLSDHFHRVLLWNTVPFHPHQPGQPLSIRTPTASEVRVWGALVPEITAIVQPRHVLAVGRIAERACAANGIATTYVRHPSQGGANLFREGVRPFLTLGSQPPA